MELAGPWVPDQGLNLGPRRQRADAPSANRWTAFPEKRRMLSGNVLRPLLPPQSPKARAGDARQRCSSGPEQRHLDLLPTHRPASRTRTPACSPSSRLPGAAGHSWGTSAALRPGGLALRYGSLPTKATGADLVLTESEPHLLRVQGHG